SAEQLFVDPAVVTFAEAVPLAGHRERQSQREIQIVSRNVTIVHHDCSDGLVSANPAESQPEIQSFARVEFEALVFELPQETRRIVPQDYVRFFQLRPEQLYAVSQVFRYAVH